MKRAILLFALLLLVGLAGYGQATPHWANAAVVEWDAPTALSDGSPIPAGEVVLYDVLVAPMADRASFIAQSQVSVAESPVTAPGPGDWLVGVRSVRIIDEQQLPSTILWSDDPSNPEPFFLRYALPYGEPGSIRFRL